MTVARRDTHSTEFGLWLRKQPEIDSSFGFVATNLDYVWSNYKTREWMLIEEKRFNKQPHRWQLELFRRIESAIKQSPEKQFFKGFHLLVFENTSPDDGKMWLDHCQISKPELLSFLRFENDGDCRPE